MKRLPFLAGSAALLAAGKVPDWDRVVDAAKKEGAVTFYSSLGTDDQLRAAADAFQKQYGIAVTISFASGPLNMQKIAAEAQTGRVLCDVLSAGFSDIEILNRAGSVEALDIPNAAAVLPDLRVLDVATPMYVNLYGILVNTKALGSTPAPVSWKGLLDRRLAGNIVMQDPRIDGGGVSVFIGTYNAFGVAYQKALAARRPVFNSAGSGIAAEESVARGDYTVLVGGRPRAVTAYPQAPLRWISPVEGSVPVPIGLTQIKRAQHPNAARVWANFLLSRSVQSSFSTNALPAVKNAQILNPVFKQRIKLLAVYDPRLDRKRYYADATQIYGAQ